MGFCLRMKRSQEYILYIYNQMIYGKISVEKKTYVQTCSAGSFISTYRLWLHNGH